MARVGLCRLSSEGVAAVQKKYRDGRWVNIAAFCANIGIPRSTYYELIGRRVWFEQATLEDKLAAIGIVHADYERLCEFKDREFDALLLRLDSQAAVCAFLMTDIEGSVRLWDAHPQTMRTALAHHDALLQQTIHQHGGRIFKTLGDGVCAAFATVPKALAAAIAAQQALIVEPWPVPLKVRMALHIGEAEERNGDYFGPTLHRVARLLAIGHGGQILLTQVTCDAVRDHLPDGVSLRDMHTHRLRDIQQPEHVWQLLHPALPADFPPLRSLQAFANNLPVQTTSFIGREQETVQVKGLLEKTRLLTLLGAGGCGKTRLSLQVAVDLLEAYPDGVWQIELAQLADPALVPQAVTTALGLREQPGQTLMQTLTDYLRDKTTLLLLDNCEHLIASCARLADSLLRTCPTVALLATSREALHIAGESVWRVPPLSQPTGDVLPQEEAAMVSALLGSDAVRLFVERACSQRSDFTLTRQNGPLVAEVCGRLDGIPLAIELAAARVRALTLEQLAARLDRRFSLLTGGDRIAAPRQQTLRALIDWSYDLLEASEKTILARLSVFVGGWTLEAAGTVCAGNGIEDWEILDLLTSLTDKSLVVFEERFGAGRYRLLETIRQYAQERLGAAEETREWTTRHRDYFLNLAEEIRPKLNGPEQAQWLSVLEEEHDNLRQALTLYTKDAEEAEAGEKGLRLGAALEQFWQVRGHLSEGRETLLALLARTGGQEPTKARADALNGVGVLTHMQSDYAQARILLEESLAIRRELMDRSGIAASLTGLGFVAGEQGDYARARGLHEESLVIRRELGNMSGIAASLSNLGYMTQMQMDYAVARILLEESLAIRRELGDKGGIAYSLLYLGLVAADQGDYAVARVLYAESLAMFRELGNKWGITLSLCNLGFVVGEQGDYAEARVLLEEGLPIARELGFKWSIAASLHSLGFVSQAQGDYVQAWVLLEESLRMFQELGDRRGIVYDLEAFASLAVKEAQEKRSACLWGAAAALRESLGVPLLPAEREKQESEATAVQRTLGAAAFALTWGQGHTMTMEQAIEYALKKFDK